MADILLSYERTDRQRVAPIVALLETHGWSVQWEPASDDPAAEREQAAAGCIIAAWSIDSLESAAVLGVASRGLTRGTLVSVSIDFSRPPRELEQAPSLALAGWTGDASSPRAQELLAAVGDLLARAPAAALTQPPAEPATARAFAPPAEAQPAEFYVEPAGEPEVQPEPEVYAEPTERVPELIRDEGAAEPVWAFPDEPEEDRARHRPPPVLLRERGQHPTPGPMPPAARRTSLARRLVAVAAVAGVAIISAAGVLWLMEWQGGQPSGTEVATTEVAPAPSSKPVAAPTAPDRGQKTKVQAVKPQAFKPQEAKPQEAKPIQPTPAALPKDVEIEDLLGQVTPRVEELLADARRLIGIGDIRGARQVLAAPETARSGSLTFLLAETYDPNILPAALKDALADPQRARALYRKARDLGDGRAQGRLDVLKTGACLPAPSARAGHSPCPAAGVPG
jgi:hypothetical protein